MTSTKSDADRVNFRNQYTEMAEFYDVALLSGYYDYEQAAKSLASYIQAGNSVLEIGVGTGLLMAPLFNQQPECEFYGIDHTRNMLEKAKERLNPKVHLLEEDVGDMQLGKQFDVIFSHGGVWVFLTDVFMSHIQDDDFNKKALANIYQHLKKGGLFIINIQSMHKSAETPLKDGLIFRQVVDEQDTVCYKDYIFEKEGKILSKQRCTYRLWRGEEGRKLLEDEIGFQYLEISSDDKYRIYKKSLD